jgi:mono/diheme cytochrome c family protein
MENPMNRACLALLLAVSLAACDGEDPAATPDAGPTQEEILARGRYLVNDVGQCSFCHTPRLQDGSLDQTKLFSGTLLGDLDPSNPDVGLIYTRNLTPHATGLLNASDADIMRVFREGKRTDGKFLVPVMPYWIFTNMTDDDLHAIIAYLRSLVPVDNLVPPNQPPFDNLPGASPPIQDSQIPMPKADYPNQEEALKGRYIAGKAGLCVDCHTPSFALDDPDLFVFLIQRDKLFQGNRAMPKEQLGYFTDDYPAIIFTANVTSDVETGIGRYSVTELANIFNTGQDKEGDFLCAPTHGSPNAPYAALKAEDKLSVAHYLLSIEAVTNAETATCEAIQ